MQTSKIKTIIPQPDKEWNGKILRKRSLLLEDGTAGTVTLFPEAAELAEGQEIEYESEDKGYGVEIKLKREGGGGGGFKSKAWTPEQVAQQDAVKITCSALESGKLELKDWQMFFDQTKEFMLSKSTKADDLPF